MEEAWVKETIIMKEVHVTLITFRVNRVTTRKNFQ
jgi:hypothetical protein